MDEANWLSVVQMNWTLVKTRTNILVHRTVRRRWAVDTRVWTGRGANPSGKVRNTASSASTTSSTPCWPCSSASRWKGGPLSSTTWVQFTNTETQCCDIEDKVESTGVEFTISVSVSRAKWQGLIHSRTQQILRNYAASTRKPDTYPL